MGNYMPILISLSCLQGVIIAAITKVTGSLDPILNTTAERVTVIEGSRAILPCSVSYLGKQQSVIWVNPRKTLISHADRRMIDDHRISIERPYIHEWNLLIRQVQYNDSGTYECRLNTSPTQNKKVTLVVKVPPTILASMSSDRITLEEGETATLICNVTGIPKPNVTWFKRESIDSKKVERIGTEGEVLVIHNVSRMCDGVYECWVDNGIPPGSLRAIRVVVEYAPEVQLPNRRIGQILGKETILDCVISANPQAVTEWRRGGRALHKTEKHDIDVFRDEIDNAVTLSLRIRNLSREDYGQYVCVGSNHIGEDQEEMTLYEIVPTTTTTTTTTVIITTTSNTKNPEYRYEYEGELSKVHNSHSSSRHHGNQGVEEESRKGEGDPYAQSREGDQDWRQGTSKGNSPSSVSGKEDNPYKGNTWSVSKPGSGSPINKGHTIFSSYCFSSLICVSAVTSLLLATV